MMTDRRSAFTLLRVVLSIVLASVPVLVHAHDRFPTDFSALGATASFSGYTVDRYNTSYTTKTLGPHVPGEDARYSLSFKASFPPASVHATLGSFTKLEYLFNLTTGSTMAARVRIIPAYPSRAMSGTTPVDCASHTDYWAEFWGVQTLKVYSFTYSVRADATLTYTVPPFPYRFCIAPNLVGVNITSRDVDDRRVSAHVNTSFSRYQTSADIPWVAVQDSAHIHSVETTATYVWESSSAMYTGDYAAIKIIQNGYRHPFQVPSTSDVFSGDLLKLVPAGFPCTYERPSQSIKYCGGHAVSATGVLDSWRGAYCPFEGSVQDGVARVGTTTYNPFVDTLSATKLLTYENMVGGEDLVAYLRLPSSAGAYDLCFSARGNRVTANRNTSDIPIFGKIFKRDAGTCASASITNKQDACMPKTRLVVTDSATQNPLRWSSPDVLPGGWGVIKVYHPSGAATQSNGPATAWELSATKSHYTTIGGDQFRLVRSTHFASSAITYGDMYKEFDGTRLQTVPQRVTSKTATRVMTAYNRLMPERSRQAVASSSVRAVTSSHTATKGPRTWAQRCHCRQRAAGTVSTTTTATTTRDSTASTPACSRRAAPRHLGATTRVPPPQRAACPTATMRASLPVLILAGIHARALCPGRSRRRRACRQHGHTYASPSSASGTCATVWPARTTGASSSRRRRGWTTSSPAPSPRETTPTTSTTAKPRRGGRSSCTTPRRDSRTRTTTSSARRRQSLVPASRSSSIQPRVTRTPAPLTPSPRRLETTSAKSAALHPERAVPPTASARPTTPRLRATRLPSTCACHRTPPPLSAWKAPTTACASATRKSRGCNFRTPTISATRI
eukprot:PhM_4_TR10438/c1_g1_i2/m.78104